MKLLEFCQKVYTSENRDQSNGIDATQNRIIIMVGIVYNQFTLGFKGTDYIFPSLETLLDQEMTTGDSFNAQNLADVIAIVFDVVTEQNLNPVLWRESESIGAEISHTFAVLFHGPLAQVVASGKGAARGEIYSEVKASLLRDLSKSRNPFEL